MYRNLGTIVGLAIVIIPIIAVAFATFQKIFYNIYYIFYENKKAKTIIFTEKYTLISNLLDASMCVHFLRNIETSLQSFLI